MISTPSLGQSHWSHYATTQHARSMGQAATMADGSILLFGGQVQEELLTFLQI